MKKKTGDTPSATLNIICNVRARHSRTGAGEHNDQNWKSGETIVEGETLD